MRLQIINLLEISNTNLEFDLVTVNIEDYVDKIIEKATILKITKHDELIAFIAYYDNDEKKENAFLSMLVVHPEYQFNGYGKILLNRAITKLNQKGFKYFELEVMKFNEKGIRFYLKHDFQVVELKDSIYRMKKIIL